MTGISHLTDAQLAAQRRQLAEEARARRERELHRASLNFKVGDLAEFTDKRGQRVRFVVSRINRNSLSGKQTDAPTRWRVTTTMCRLVGADKPSDKPAARGLTAPSSAGAGAF